MTASAISFDIRNTAAPKLTPTSIIAINNDDQYVPLPISKILKQRAKQFALALVHEVRNPLTNINLSVKLLESAIKNDDLKAYLQIITRSSIRINSLMTEFLKHQLPDETISKKHSIHELLDEVIEMTNDRIM